jgi:site-specific recombinase XerD
MQRIEGNSNSAVCLDIDKWPEADANLWRTAMEAADPFQPRSAAACWSERSRAKTAKGYGRWLGWAMQNGVEMNRSPADRVTEHHLRNYLAELRSRNGDFTVLCRVQELCDAIRVMAPDRDWNWLRRLQNALRSRAVPVRDKASRLQHVGALVQLGKALMRMAEESTKPPLSRAVLYRDGLMITLEALRPLRLCNLAMIMLDRHLVRQTTAYRLYFAGSETKGRRAFEAAIPAEMTAELDRYVNHYRPLLLTRGGRQPPADTDRLWISEIGTPLDEKSIPQRIKKHTRAAFGKHIWLHLFRDCAATTMAVQDPKNARSTRIILHHSTLATSERHYNQARGLEASRRYHRIVSDLLERFDGSSAAD